MGPASCSCFLACWWDTLLGEKQGVHGLWFRTLLFLTRLPCGFLLAPWIPPVPAYSHVAFVHGLSGQPSLHDAAYTKSFLSPLDAWSSRPSTYLFHSSHNVCTVCSALTGVFVLIDILKSLKAEKTLQVLFPHTDCLLARDQEELFFAPPPPAVFRGFLFLCSGTLK